MMATCKHIWEYEYAVYGGRGRDSAKVRRYCRKCETEQVGDVKEWREPRENEFDTSLAEVLQVEGAGRELSHVQERDTG